MNKKTNRDRIQQEIGECLHNETDLLSGIVYAGTGVGKTRVSINYLIKFRELYKRIPRTLFVVPTTKLRDVDIPDEFRKWGCEDLLSMTKLICYASLAKQEGEQYDVIILDESHNITDGNFEFFNRNKYDHILMMTATEPVDEEKRDLLEYLGPVRAEYNLDEAVDDGVVKPFDIFVVRTDLSTERTVRIEPKSKASFTTSEAKNYEFLTKQVNKFQYVYWNNKTPGTEKLYMSHVSRRARFIYDCKSKRDVTKQIINLLPKDEKVLIFAKSIFSAEDICPFTYHSETDDKNLIAFNSGKIKRLSCVDALNEGVNLAGLSIAVIHQLDSNPKNLIQRIGRTLRFEKGKRAKIFITVARNTQDEVWLAKAIAPFDEANIHYVELENLDRYMKLLYSNT